MPSTGSAGAIMDATRPTLNSILSNNYRETNELFKAQNSSQQPRITLSSDAPRFELTETNPGASRPPSMNFLNSLLIK